MYKVEYLRRLKHGPERSGVIHLSHDLNGTKCGLLMEDKGKGRWYNHGTLDSTVALIVTCKKCLRKL